VTKAQFDEAYAILEKDCQITKFYCTDEGTCAIGALALAAGISESDLNEAGPMAIHHKDCAPIAKAIFKKFGLDLFGQSSIQNSNDCYKVRADRVNKVLAQLEHYYKERNPERT